MPSPKGNVPIIALTAHALSGVRAEYIAAGMNDYVSKPIDAQTLLSKLADIGDGLTPVLAQSPAPQAHDPIDHITKTLAAANVDRNCLDTIDTIMPPREAREFIESYLGDVTAHIAHIGDRLAAGDLSSIARDSHNLLSIAGNVGARNVSEMALAIETACRDGKPTRLTDLLTALKDVSSLANAALAAWIDMRYPADQV